MTTQGEHAARTPRERAGVPAELLDHACRCWEAEVENARRHATRINLLVPGILAVLGLGAFNLGWLGQRAPAVASPWGAWIIKVLLLGALLLFTRALLILLMVRQRRRPLPTASFRLEIPQAISKDPDRVDRGEAARTVFLATHEAYMDLRRRNASEQARIDRGQRCLLIALVHALAAIASYTVLATLP